MLWGPCGGKRTEGGGGSAGRLGQGRPPLFVIRPGLAIPAVCSVPLPRGWGKGERKRAFAIGTRHPFFMEIRTSSPLHLGMVRPPGKSPGREGGCCPLTRGFPRSCGKIFFARRTKRRHNEGPFEKGKPLEKVRCDGLPRRMRTGRGNPNPGGRGPFQASSLSSEPFLW